MRRYARTTCWVLGIVMGLGLLAVSARAEEWTFVSIPDFINADIGDISGLPGYDGGANSTTASYEAALSFVLGSVAAESPDFMLVAGDLVNGHWYKDVDGRQIFGPVSTLAEKRTVVNTAADLYYGEWKQRFADNGLTTHVALGDHDIGDNNWAAGSDKSKLVATYKDNFADQFTKNTDGTYRYAERPVGTAFEGTAYAVQHNNVLVVTVDVFRQDDPNVSADSKTGSVERTVDGDQLTWLDGVLADAETDPTIDHVIVQGHIPVLSPVRKQNSSGLTMPGGETTEFWQTLEDRDVDLYLAGEVHDMTASNHGAVEQVAHGGIIGYASDINYLVGTVDGDRIDLELKAIDITNSGSSLWQAGSNRPKETVTFDEAAFQTVGTLTIDKSSGETVYSNRTGEFRWFGTFPEAESKLLVHMKLDETAGAATAENSGTSAASNDGTVSGASFVEGEFGNALAFDASDKVTAGNTPLTGGTARTTSVWVKTTATGLVTMFTMGTNSAGGKWDFDLDNGKLEVGVGSGRSIAGATCPAVNDGEWHLVTAVLPMAGGTIDDVLFYIDGILYADATTSTRAVGTASAGSLILGHSANGAGFQQFAGLLDDVALWTEALSDIEVKALFSLGDNSDLAYDAALADEMFRAFGAEADVLLGGKAWYYDAVGLLGDEGTVVDLGGGYYEINLGSGAGFSTLPEPATALVLAIGGLVLLRRRRR